MPTQPTQESRPSASELKEILAKHLAWTRGEPEGECADLRGADLSGANLSGAYLRGAYLRGAKHILCLDMHDPRGYTPVAVNHDGAWRIFSGCRDFTFDEALKHWGKGYGGDREIGDRYLRALSALPKCEAAAKKAAA